MDLSKYRKLVAAMVTSGAIYVSKKFGLDFGAVGLPLGEFAGEAADFILTIGIPGYFLWLIPQDPEDGSEGPVKRKINNRRLLISVAAVIGATAGIVGVSYL